MSFLNGFEEDIETTKDSNALPSSCTQGSKAVIGTLPNQSLKRKFENNGIGASPGATSTSKPKQ